MRGGNGTERGTCLATRAGTATNCAGTGIEDQRADRGTRTTETSRRTVTTHTKFLGLIATLLGGLFVGLWIAAETWRPPRDLGERGDVAANEHAGVPTRDGASASNDGAARNPISPSRGDLGPNGDPSRRESTWNAADSTRLARADAAVELDRADARPTLEPLAKGPERAHARPRPSLDDERYTPGPDDVCLAAIVEDANGHVPLGARVAVFAVDDERPRVPALSQTKAEDGGLAYARAHGATDLIVVAFAPGFVPETRRMRAEAGTRSELDPFVLRRGETIAGRVVAGGGPLARAQVDAEARATSLAIECDGGPLGWRHGRFVWARASAETREDGRYECSGLESGEHTLWIATVRQRDAAIDVSLVPRLHASAPGIDADFTLPGAWLELSFEAERRPLCCVEVQIQAGDRQFMRTTDERGRIRMRLQPAAIYPLVVARSGYSTRHLELRGMSDGEHGAQTIELTPQKVLATLEVDDQRTSGVDEAVFRFHPRVAVMGQPDFEVGVQRDRATGRFVIAGVPSGSWRITMRSGRRLIDPSASWRSDAGFYSNCDAETLVTMPDEGTTRVTMTTTTRGHVAVTARTVSGTRILADCALVDVRGDPVESVVVGPRVPDLDTAFRDATTNVDEPTMVYAPVCAGVVDLVVSREGLRPVRQRVALVAGRVTEVDVTLLPR